MQSQVELHLTGELLRGWGSVGSTASLELMIRPCLGSDCSFPRKGSLFGNDRGESELASPSRRTEAGMQSWFWRPWHR